MQTLFWSILNISAKYHQNRSLQFELYRFKVGAFFLRWCFLLFLVVSDYGRICKGLRINSWYFYLCWFFGVFSGEIL